MANEQTSSQELEVRFVVRSSHPNISSADMATALAEENLRELQGYLQARYGKIEVSVEREESFPIDWATAYLVLKFVVLGIASKMLGEIGSDAYKFLKDRTKNGSLQREQEKEE